MLSAQLKSGKLITLALLQKDEIEAMRQTTFYCPVCQTEVIVRAGPKVIPHFAHRSVVKCVARGGEGAYHETGKLLLYQWLKNQGLTVHLEHYLEEIKQRADLFLQIGKKQVAIEFQCVSLSTKEIMKRNEGYHRLHIRPIWILGAKLFKRKANNVLVIPPYQQSFIHQFSKTNTTFLFYFCPNSQLFNVIYRPYFHKRNEAVVLQRFLKMDNINFLQLFDDPYVNKAYLYKVWQREKQRFRLRTGQTYGRERKWQYWLYGKGLTRQALPSIIHIPIQSQWKMKVPLWQWQSYFVLEFLKELPLHDLFSYWDAEAFIAHFMYEEALFPLAQGENNPLREYLQILCEVKILLAHENDQYEKLEEIEYFQHIEEAVKGDDELLRKFMYN